MKDLATINAFHKKVYLFTTFKCPLQCAHCINTSGPDRNEIMAESLLESCLAGIAESSRVETVVLTGGEPFWIKDLLLDGIVFLRNNGIKVSIQTSAYWADTRQKADQTLKNFTFFDHLGISTDQFHQKFISLKYVANACAAAVEYGIKTELIMMAFDHEQTKKRLQSLIPKELFDELTFSLNDSIHLTGRGCNLFDHPWVTKNQKFPEKSCLSCCYAAVLPDGTVTACCNDMTWTRNIKKHFELGHLSDSSFLEISNAADKNYLVHAMRIWGPKKFADLALEKGFGNSLKKQYIVNNVCDLCLTLFSSSDIVQIIKQEINNPEFQREISLARALAFGEPSLLK